MIKIGVTGGICSGKSTICRYLEELAFPVFYSDISAKNLVNNLEIKNKVIEEFGSESYLNNVYNVKYISNIVFKDSIKLKTLTEIFKPYVDLEFNEFCNKNSDNKIIFYESAIIFETNSENNFDYIICAHAPVKTVKEWLRIRNNLNDIEINDRLNSQLDTNYKIQYSHFNINTSLDYKQQINNILDKLNK